jgi:hypothetical protein
VIGLPRKISKNTISQPPGRDIDMDGGAVVFRDIVIELLVTTLDPQEIVELYVHVIISPLSSVLVA